MGTTTSPKAKFGRAAVTLSLAAQDALVPVLDILNQTLVHLNSGELLAARGAFLGVPERIAELDMLLNVMARTAHVDRQ
jgi:hypothetical protein